MIQNYVVNWIITTLKHNYVVEYNWAAPQNIICNKGFKNYHELNAYTMRRDIKCILKITTWARKLIN